jgi:hypothetical protein
MSKKTILSPVNEAIEAVISPRLTATVVTLFKNEEKKISAIRADQDKAIQAALDAMWIACNTTKAEFMKGNAVHNPARRQIKAMFDSIIGPNTTKSTAGTYGSCFWIAFEAGIPFSRDLANKKTEAKKKAATTATTAPTATTAKSKVITLVEAQRSFSVALAQLRAVNQADLAGELLDVMLARFEDFKESTTK